MRRVAKLSSTLMNLVKLSLSPMILVKLRLLSSVRVKYSVQVRCLRRSETCEVSENYFGLFTIYLMLFCSRYLPHNCIVELAACQLMWNTCSMYVSFMFVPISYLA